MFDDAEDLTPVVRAPSWSKGIPVLLEDKEETCCICNGLVNLGATLTLYVNGSVAHVECNSSGQPLHGRSAG